MARRPSPAMLFGKWVIVPIALALLGYYVVGPRIGKDSDTKPAKPPETGSTPAASGTPDAPKHHVALTPTNGSTSSPEPDLDITVHKAKKPIATVAATEPAGTSTIDSTTVASANPTPHRRRRRKAAPKPADETDKDSTKPKNSTEPPPDQGGSAGSTTAGGRV